MSALLEVDGLSVAAPGRRGTTYPVRDVSLAVDGRGIVGVVGESGCGKSTLLRAIAGVLPRGLRAVEGTVRVDGREIDVRRPSGEVAMVFQDPMTGLNPVMTVGEHVAEVPRRRDGLGRRAAHDLAVDLLKEVGIDDAEHRVDAYPHELSGGLRQRVLIAAALSGSPRLLLCDEPTTALDVTVQARFVALLGRLVEDRGLGVLYVTHDLPLLGTMCDRINVMYAGQVVETSAAGRLHADPLHPYSAALVQARPDVASTADRLVAIPGRPVSAFEAPAGCRFAPRCPHVVDGCRAHEQALTALDAGRVRCERAADLRGRLLDPTQSEERADA